MTLASIDDLLALLREQFSVRQREAEERVARIKTAADEYLRAVETDFVADIAIRNGIDVDRALNSMRAALTLRSLVEALPESRVRTEMSQVVVQPEASQDAKVPAPAAPQRRTETDPDVLALYAEFDATDFDHLSDAVFKPTAEEFACRARGLQDDAASDGGDLLTRIFRKLTAIAYQRNVGGIFGLARNHSGDWTTRAARARLDRDTALAAPAPKKVSGKIVIPEALRAEFARAAEDDDTGSLPDLPRLAAACAARPLVLVGGLVKQEKLERLRKLLNIEIDWLSTDNANQQGIASLERRVRDRRVGAVVVLEELIGHRHFSPIVDAARESDTPLAYGAKAGKASIVLALEDIETMLDQAHGATGS